MAQRRSHECAYRHRACRLAYDCDAVGVAAKGCDVVLYPFDGSHLVEEAIVARAFIGCLLRELRMCEEAKDALAVVGCHGDNALACHSVARIARLAATASHQSATVEVDKHRQVLVHLLCRSPDVEIQAVFAHLLRAEVHVAEDILLHRIGSEFLCLPHALPFLYRLRGFPSKVADWRSGKWNSLECLDAR